MSWFSFLVPTTTTDYTYKLLGTGFCTDWIFLPEGGYPPRFSPDDAFYEADPIQECLNRCVDANRKSGADTSTIGGTIGNQAFYLNSNSRCACAIGDCNSLVSSGYASYKIISGNRWVGVPRRLMLEICSFIVN